MSLKEKIASLLDSLANERELSPRSTAEVLPVPESETAKFAADYRARTGEDLDDHLREKLEADSDLRAALLKVAGSTPQRPTPLGEATDKGSATEESRAQSRKTAEAVAYDRFAQGILSLGQR